MNLTRDVRILRQKIANFACCTRFSYGTVVCDTAVLSRVSWLVGPVKLIVTSQLTFSLRSYLPTTGSSDDVV